MDNLATPTWLQEVINNGTHQSSYTLFDDKKNLFAMPANESTLITAQDSSELRSLLSKDNQKETIKVAFFRDGPFLPISTGAAYSILGMINALADSGVEVYLFYSFRGWGDPMLHKNQKFTTIFIRPEDFYSNKECMNSLLKDFQIDICQIDSAESVCIQAPLITSGTKISFEVHNVENELMKQLGVSEREILRMKEIEEAALCMSDLVFVRSDENYKSCLALGCDKNKMFIYKGGIPLENFAFNIHGGEKAKVLFLGHLNYEPNRQAVEYILKDVSPFVPEVEFIIAGRGSEDLRFKQVSDNVIFTGWVEDLNNLFASVDMGIAPLTTGSGTRLKILDYMAAGLPVIGTELAIEGLESSIANVMVVENEISKYADIIKSLYRDKGKLKFLSSSGRTFVEQERSWKRCVKDIIHTYKKSL